MIATSDRLITVELLLPLKPLILLGLRPTVRVHLCIAALFK